MAENKPGLWKRMIIIFIMGFSSGLPLLLTGGTFKMWLSREGIDVKTIGFMSWVGLAYSLKFFWAPILDRFQISRFGRRRGWLIVTQVLLIALIAAMGTFQPSVSLMPMVFTAIATAFFSATQDSVIDAYRREFLPDEELGLGSSMTTYGYRIAMLLSGGLGIGLVGDATNAGFLTWNQLYFSMSVLMAIGLVTTFLIPEPEIKDAPLTTLRETVVESFKDFFTRPKAILILLFVITYKLGDSLSGQILNKFYVDVQFSNADVGFIAKTVGLITSMVGLFLGGFMLKYMKLFRALIVCGILQGLSTAFFATLVFTGPQAWALALAVVFEDITSGMGGAVFGAYMAQLTNKRFTATQFALLTGLASSGRNLFSGFSGIMVEQLGWVNFFITCGLIAIPGIAMAAYFHRQGLDSVQSLSIRTVATS